MDIGTVKNLGGIGALLMFFGIFPYIALYGITELVGVILLLIAAKGLADYYSEDGIFNNALYGVITVIVGGVVFLAVAIYALFDFFASIGFPIGWHMTDWTTALMNLDWQNVVLSQMWHFLATLVLALVVLFVFAVLAAVLLRESLGLTSKKTGVGLFGISGTMLLVGAVLTIIAIGFLLMWISLLLIAIAFFSIGSQPAQAAPQPATQM